MNKIQSFHKETALIIAQQMTRNVTIACMKQFQPTGENAKASCDETYILPMGRSVTVECHFDGLHVLIAWFKDNDEMITRETAIDLIIMNIVRL